jgi:DNA-binding transcriptional regulator LsrR (DeoR family)
MVPVQKIHFLIVGNSHEHIFKILQEYQPDQIYLISSPEIKESTSRLKQQLEDQKISVEIIWVNPFQSDSLEKITTLLVNTGKQLLHQNPETKLFIGFTGGTNIMAIAAGYSALLLHAEGHYVLKDQNQIVPISPDHIINSIQNQLQF